MGNSTTDKKSRREVDQSPPAVSEAGRDWTDGASRASFT
jgi:hypothetical protein